jgi:hypothetical protein
MLFVGMWIYQVPFKIRTPLQKKKVMEHTTFAKFYLCQPAKQGAILEDLIKIIHVTRNTEVLLGDGLYPFQ